MLSVFATMVGRLTSIVSVIESVACTKVPRVPIRSNVMSNEGMIFIDFYLPDYYK